MTREDLDKFQKLWIDMITSCNEWWRTPIILTAMHWIVYATVLAVTGLLLLL